MITLGKTCYKRRGSWGKDKVNKTTEEAIAPEKKINNLWPCLFSLQSVICLKSWLAALGCSLLMLCKFTAGYKRQITMASQNEARQLNQTVKDEVCYCKGAWLKLVYKKISQCNILQMYWSGHKWHHMYANRGYCIFIDKAHAVFLCEQLSYLLWVLVWT